MTELTKCFTLNTLEQRRPLQLATVRQHVSDDDRRRVNKELKLMGWWK